MVTMMNDEMGMRARKASVILAASDSRTRDEALKNAASLILERKDLILAENEIDLENARSSGMSQAFLDRLLLNEQRLRSISEGILSIRELEDPLGKTISDEIRPNGIRIVKKTVPLGVIAVIFESRPNVSADSAALCIKSGNAVILRGGKEAILSNTAITGCIRDALSMSGLPSDCVQLIADTTRDSAVRLMHA